jgi:hypothetical protein
MKMYSKSEGRAPGILDLENRFSGKSTFYPFGRRLEILMNDVRAP